MKTWNAANSLIDNPLLKLNDFVAFIPPFCTSRKDIRGVPIDITEEEIISESSSPFKIFSARRFNRRVNSPIVNLDTVLINNNNPNQDNNNKVKYFPSMSICISFEGQRLPKYITLFYVSYPIYLYISRVSQCFSCYRFGHVKQNCKGYPRCFNCGEKYHGERTSCSHEVSSCINCKGKHPANSLLSRTKNPKGN